MDNKSLYEFSLFEQNDILVFKAYISDKLSYRIVNDIDKLFTPIFLKIINGKYKRNYINKCDIENNIKRPIINTFAITSDDAIANLNKFIDKAKDFYSYKASCIKVNFDYTLEFHFSGSDYEYGKYLSPKALSLSSNLINNVSNLITRNSKFSESFADTLKAGSLEIPIHFIDKNKDIKNNIKFLLASINSKSLDSKKLDDFQFHFINLFKGFNKIDTLSTLSIKLDGINYNIDLNYICDIHRYYDNKLACDVLIKGLNHIKSIDFISFKAIVLSKGKYQDKTLTFHIKKNLSYLITPYMGSHFHIIGNQINKLTFEVIDFKLISNIE